MYRVALCEFYGLFGDGLTQIPVPWDLVSHYSRSCHAEWWNIVVPI
jgi:hypothetical protein